MPGPERLATLAGDFARDHGIPCDLVVTGAEREPDSARRASRSTAVAQEALTNTATHAAAAARRHSSALDYGTDRACLEPSRTSARGPPDTLVVQNPAATASTGMRERAASCVGGSLHAEPTEGGLPVELQVPG